MGDITGSGNSQLLEGLSAQKMPTSTGSTPTQLGARSTQGFANPSMFGGLPEAQGARPIQTSNPDVWKQALNNPINNWANQNQQQMMDQNRSGLSEDDQKLLLGGLSALGDKMSNLHSSRTGSPSTHNLAGLAALSNTQPSSILTPQLQALLNTQSNIPTNLQFLLKR